jgi:hypothetical protein
MKQVKRNHLEIDVLNLFEKVGQSEGYTFNDEESGNRFINKIKSTFARAKKIPTVLYGQRTQSLFGNLLFALGKSAFIKQEDSDEFYAKDSSLKAPDFRLILDNNQTFLVEVKNYYQTNPLRYYRFKRDYLDGLRKYARINNCGLKIAIYWRKWNLWTLVSETHIKNDGKYCTISLFDAGKLNEMSLVGDCMIGTKVPLSIKIFADKNKSRFIAEDGKANFTIADIKFYCADTWIEDKFEQQLAYYLMLFGKWLLQDPIVERENDKIVSIEYQFKPETITPDQGFEIIGDLSNMFSRYYNMVTAPDGTVESIRPNREPKSMLFSIPGNYKGKYLPLWIFHVTLGGIGNHK